MAEGLFDGRYLYDHIYPRGRSGETLRAYDTQDNDRPVVIKRPVPNDAPPIRAGQEVSILAERDALRRLAGHPVLTELVDEGQFIVGGTSHRYIVMERGTGIIIADAVFELSERGERFPTLEMLVVLDNLLDLLQTAHSRDIVYNDVDAKHLFWNRDTYRLKVIDWGNAVFLEGDEVTPQGVSKASDVFQVGELLFFILTGGRRAEVPRDAEPSWNVDFGDDASTVPPDLMRVTSLALHPNPRHRYATIADLRRALTDVRKPHEAERNAILARVNERLRRDRSRDELNALRAMLEPALGMDAGYPAARNAADEIEARLKDLQIAADLDAARIYLETANWHGAADILGELKSNARGETLAIIKLLFDWAVLMLEDDSDTLTPTINEAIQLVFDGAWERAAHTLVLAPSPDAATHRIHMRLAERVTSHLPDVVLLRPNLFRLGEALATLDGTDGVHLTEQRELLDQINVMLDEMAVDEQAVNMVALRDTYRGIVDRLNAMTTLMEAVNIGWGERRLPLSSLQRAQNAAMNLADNMHVIGKQAAGAPRDALGALDNARAIDPTNPAWDSVRDLLNDLYNLLQSYQTYVPVADGSDLAVWLERTQQQINPYRERLFDEMLNGMSNGLKVAAEQWGQYDDRAVAGNRAGLLDLLATAAEAVGTVSPTLAGWFNQLRSVVNGADYVERHALSGGLGRALADGWAAFDDGRLSDAERLAVQASQAAKTNLHKAVVKRLRTLAETTRNWVERNGYVDQGRTEDAVETLNDLYSEEENTVRRRFNAQMPAQDTYLKAMGKGLVEVYGMHSTAAQRLLFADYVLQGAIDAHEGVFENVAFWMEAAGRTLPGKADAHPMLKTLVELTERRQDLLELADAFNALGGPATVEEIESVRAEFENHKRAKIIGEAVHALREVENALPDWSNAEFRTAGMKLEKAAKAAHNAQTAMRVDLSSFIAWLEELGAAAAQLHATKLSLVKAAESRPDTPTTELADLHETLVTMTEVQVGTPYVATLKLWADTYNSFAAVAESDQRRSARLAAYNDLFRAMFIDRHPAYPLYRHWYDMTERAAEFPAPPTEDPQPRMTDDDGEEILTPTITPDEDDMASAEVDEEVPRSLRRGRRAPMIVIVLVVVAGLAVGGLALSNLFAPEATPTIAVTISATPDEDATGTADANTTATGVAIIAAFTDTPTPIPLETMTAAAALTENADAELTLTAIALELATTEPPTATIEASDDAPTEVTEAAEDGPTATATVTEPVTPSATPTASDTPTATTTPTPSDTPTPTVPAAGRTGEVDMLTLFDRIERENPDAAFWDPVRFAREGEAWRLGVGAETAEETLALGPPPELAVAYLGSGAPSRLSAVEVTVALTTFNPTLLSEDGDGVTFGMVLAPADSVDPLTSGVGLQIDVVQPGVVNIGGREAGTFDVISQRALNAVIARIRLERTSDGRVQAFFNGEALGFVGEDISPDAPLLPVLFATDGGVILSVTEWRVVLR